MFSFNSVRNGKVIENTCSIEQKTRLLLVEQKSPNEEWPSYIRMTLQQIEALKRIMFTGRFGSNTIPVNTFYYENGTFTLVCRQENQVIKLNAEEMGNVFHYAEIHRQRIAKFDAQFRSRR